MDLFKKIVGLVEGKKTHALGLGGLGLAAYMASGGIVPVPVWLALGSAIIMTFRSAIKKL